MSGFVKVTDVERPRSGWHVRRNEQLLAPPARVWAALTEKTHLQQWCCDQAEVDLRAGGHYRLSGDHAFHGAPSKDAPLADYRIDEVEEERALTFQWPMAAAPTEVRYELTPTIEGTQITVRQSAPEAPRRWATTRGEHPDWWWVLLPTLRSYLERGTAALRVNYSALSTAESVRFDVSVTTFAWVVWQKLTAAGELARWWQRGTAIDSTEGTFTTAESDTRCGPRRIEVFEPENRFVHDWHWDATTTSRIEWRVEEGDEATRVSVEDHGPWPADCEREEIAIYWASTVLELKRFAERGISAREFQH